MQGQMPLCKKWIKISKSQRPWESRLTRDPLGSAHPPLSRGTVNHTSVDLQTSNGVNGSKIFQGLPTHRKVDRKVRNTNISRNRPGPQNRVFRLARHLHSWQTITSDSWVLNIITNSYSLEFQTQPPTQFVTTPPSPQLLTEVQSLQDKLAIEPVPQQYRGTDYYSRYFLVPKRDSGLRPILDLRGLNHFLRDRKFCMTTLQSIFPFILKDAWLASIDLQDAYFHISIHEHHHKFLHFAVGEFHYQYIALPFGLPASPRVFTKCVVVIAAYLRLQGVQIFQYLGDWLLLAHSEAHLRSHLQITLSLLKDLGILVNLKKSALTPVHRLTYIGATLDSTLSMAFLPPEQASSLRDLALKMIS